MYIKNVLAHLMINYNIFMKYAKYCRMTKEGTINLTRYNQEVAKAAGRNLLKNSRFESIILICLGRQLRCKSAFSRDNV